ncbi:hypothetical protein GGR54DRAFT_183421 [Hypoxylon sp. NC1633]|nr:hypothetical protein GGR54DRAFT_183421 [Hypoxylon sp. NC1633]
MVIMMPTILTRLSALVLASWLAISSATPLEDFGPSLDSARENGPQIFNALHNAMREFGSALHHNGMSLFPAVIPEGVLLYHGTRDREVPKSYEWLAFEIEHAEIFAHGFRRNRTEGEHRPNAMDIAMSFLHQAEGQSPKYPPFEALPGYLHIYQADRPLNVLYIDGTAAGKSTMGTVDTQDILLTGNKSRNPWDDWGRARDLCKLGQEWEIDGFIRMEPGFEVIYCDFTNGLKLLSTNRRPGSDDPGDVYPTEGFALFEWARGAAQRYNGITASRVLLDYSSVVSAFFYPLNLTNPDPERPELPRLSGASSEEMEIIKEHVASSVARSMARKQRPVDWQGITDMIVTRYLNRLPLIAQTDSIEIAKSEVNILLNVHIDYSEEGDKLKAARQRCTEFYLKPVQAKTEADQFLYAGIESTAATICAALFKARQLIVEDTDADESTALGAAQKVVNDLMDTLRWSNWKECGRCEPDEVCFVPMWPFGNVEDYNNPSCLNYSAVLGRHSYWKDLGRTPGHPPPSPPSLLCVDGQACQKQLAGLKNEEL